MTKVAQDQRRAYRTALPAALCAGLSAAILSAGLWGCGGSRATTEPRPTVRTGGGNDRAGDLIQRRRDAFKINHEDYRELGYRLDWRGFPVVQAGERVQFLDLYDDVVVAQESAGTVSVLEASNGALRNSTQVASPLSRYVGNFRLDGTMVVSTDNEAIVMDLETGGLLDRHNLNRVVTTHPVYFANQKVYGSAIGHVYSQYMSPAVDAWAFDMGGPIDTDPVLIGSVVSAISRRGDIVMIDVPTGTLVGRARIFGGAEAAPVAGEGAVFFASLDQSIYAFELDGRQRWRVRTEQPLYVTPTYHQGVLYVVSDDQGLRALDANTGAQLWAQADIAGRVIGVRDGRLLTWDGQTAALVEPGTGDVIFSATLPGVSILKPDEFVDGELYAVSDGGVIAKFQPRD